MWNCCIFTICSSLIFQIKWKLSSLWMHLSNLKKNNFSFVHLQVYWIGPVAGAMLAGVSHEFFFARSASRQKLVACLTCKDIEIVETTSMTGSSLSTVTQNAMRAKQANKQENNWVHIREKKHAETHTLCCITVILMETHCVQFIGHKHQAWLWWGAKKKGAAMVWV